jgi:hypothetical protein
MSGRELDRKRNNEGRRDGRVHDGNQTGTISMIGRENETRTAALAVTRSLRRRSFASAAVPYAGALVRPWAASHHSPRPCAETTMAATHRPAGACRAPAGTASAAPPRWWRFQADRSGGATRARSSQGQTPRGNCPQGSKGSRRCKEALVNPSTAFHFESGVRQQINKRLIFRYVQIRKSQRRSGR